MGKVITVASGAGKAGKTTIAAAISSSLAVLGYRTLCLDFGKGVENIRFALCMTGNEESRYVDETGMQSRIVDICIEHPEIPKLFILSASALFDLHKQDASDIKPLFSEIRSEFDYCVIDTPPISNPGFNLAHTDADMTIVVTNGRMPKMSDVLRTAKTVKDFGITDIKLLINRLHRENKKQILQDAAKATGTVEAMLIGQIPEDTMVSKALNAKKPLVSYKRNRIVINFLNIAQSITGEAASLEEIKPLPAPAKPKKKQVQQSPPVPPALPSNQDTDNNPVSGTSMLLGSYGDPEQWAKSTLKSANIDELVQVYVVTPGLYATSSTIRNRMWLHDLLDDKKIPYFVDIGGMAGSKVLVEAQYIYVEEKNALKALTLINKFNDSGSIIHDTSDDDGFSSVSEDGIPQKKCTSCGEEIDFDYYKCPFCKGQAG